MTPEHCDGTLRFFKADLIREKVPMRKINHLAVFALVIFQQILGFVWYSKYLFGYTWMEWLKN